MNKWNVIHKMKFHPTIKRKGPVIQHGWLNLTNITLSKRSQTPKITFIFNYQKSRKQISDCLEQREEAGTGYKWIQENILEQADMLSEDSDRLCLIPLLKKKKGITEKWQDSWLSKEKKSFFSLTRLLGS